jgi:hypothetical protein
MPGCPTCPFRDHPTIRGAALLTGHARYCELIDPAHRDHDPRIDQSYRRLTADLLGLPPWECGVTPGRPRRSHRPSAKPRAGRNPRTTFVPIADDTAHRQVYDAAIGCPYRVESRNCCTPDRCGPGGIHAGQKIGIGVCYPCTVGRLGITAGAD